MTGGDRTWNYSVAVSSAEMGSVEANHRAFEPARSAAMPGPGIDAPTLVFPGHRRSGWFHLTACVFAD